MDIIGGRYNGSYADAFSQKLTRLVNLLHSRGKTLTGPTMATLQRKINDMRTLERDLDEFMNKLEHYYATNPNDGITQIDDALLNKVNTIVRRLHGKVHVVVNGLHHITARLVPTVRKPMSYTMR
jgi:hypothetical protein